jgi:chemotaxis protein histidine kinase CheA
MEETGDKISAMLQSMDMRGLSVSEFESPEEKKEKQKKQAAEAKEKQKQQKQQMKELQDAAKVLQTAETERQKKQGTDQKDKEKEAQSKRKAVLLRKIKNYKNVFGNKLKNANLGPTPALSASEETLKAYYNDIQAYMGQEGALEQARMYTHVLVAAIEKIFTEFYPIEGVYLEGFTKNTFTKDSKTGVAPIDICEMELNELIIDKEEWFTTRYFTRGIVKIGRLAQYYSQQQSQLYEQSASADELQRNYGGL